MSQQLDNFMAFSILSRLAKPFNEWDAYKLGLIDNNGNVLKKRSSLSTSKEKDAFGTFDLICLNLKKIIEKIPQYKVAMAPLNLLQKAPIPNNIGSNISLGALSGSFFLLKESIKDPNDIEYLEERMEYYSELVKRIIEDEGGVAVNNVGSGNIAGTGIGASGEPGVPKKTIYRKRNEKEENKLTINIKRLITQLKGCK